MYLDAFIVIALLGLSACFEGAEAAFLSLSDVRVLTLIKSNGRNAVIIEKLKSNVRKLLGTLLLGQTFCDIAASAIATVATTNYFGDAYVGVLTGLMTLVVLIFVNLIPKALAAQHPERWCQIFARPLFFLTKVLGPVVLIIDKFVGIFVSTRHGAAGIGEEDIKTMAHMGLNAGAIEHGEKEMIDRVFLFNDITAQDVMTPKVNMFMLDGRKSVSEALPAINVSKYSRFPVYDGERSNIVGIVHIKDVLEKVFMGDVPPDTLLVKDITLSATFIPETKLIDDLFREFQKNHVHMAIVVNEYGSVVGLVTLEDLIEELVGEISDETDIDEHVIKRVDKYTVLVHGDVQIQNINRFFNAHIEAPDHKNLSWVILEKLGSIPTEGQQVHLEKNITATIEKIDNRRISKVRLVKAAEPAPKSE